MNQNNVDTKQYKKPNYNNSFFDDLKDLDNNISDENLIIIGKMEVEKLKYIAMTLENKKKSEV